MDDIQYIEDIWFLRKNSKLINLARIPDRYEIYVTDSLWLTIVDLITWNYYTFDLFYEIDQEKYNSLLKRLNLPFLVNYLDYFVNGWKKEFPNSSYEDFVNYLNEIQKIPHITIRAKNNS